MGKRKEERRHTSRVQRIDINTQIHWLLCPNSIPDLLDNARRADAVDFASFRNLKAAIAVVFVIAGTGQSGANAGVDVGVVGQQALFMSMVEVGAVVDGGLFAGSATEDFGPPCVPGRRQWVL